MTAHSCSITEHVTPRWITYTVTCWPCGRVKGEFDYLADATEAANRHEQATA